MEFILELSPFNSFNSAVFKAIESVTFNLSLLKVFIFSLISLLNNISLFIVMHSNYITIFYKIIKNILYFTYVDINFNID